MAKNNLVDLSTTAAGNTYILGQSTAGTALASTLDSIVQNTLAVLARFYDDIGGTGTVGGSANAITLASGSSFQALASGLVVAFKAGAANTGAATMNVDSLGAKAIRRQGDAALQAGDIAANGRYLLIYDAAYNAAAGAWVLLNAAGYVPGGTDVAIADGGTGASTAAAAQTNLGIPASIPGYLWGLTLANNSGDAANDLDIATGVAVDSTNARTITLASGLTKRLDAGWAVGTNQGGLDTGSVANTTYHVWLIMRSDTGVVDVLLSASASAPTMPSSYDLKRRIGSIVRIAGSIKAFSQYGDDFVWSAPVLDISMSNPGTAALTATLSVPTGIVVEADLSAFWFNSNTADTQRFFLISSLAAADSVPSATAFSLGIMESAGAARDGDSGSVRVYTNTSGQVRHRSSASSASIAINVITRGWSDPRGRVGA